MDKHEIKATFDQLAAGYDKQWAKTAPIRDALHYLLGPILAELPSDARVLCVGVGTGVELVYLAQRNPSWSFTAVEPSGPMLDVCRQRAEEQGCANRCQFHEGYLDTFPAEDEYNAATCFLVSQFILDQTSRVEFFSEIACRLKPGGTLVSSDLASDVGSNEYEALLRMWMNLMSSADVSPDTMERMRNAYAHDVAVLPSREVASIIEAGGFESPVQFYQAGLIHAWFSSRALEPS